MAGRPAFQITDEVVKRAEGAAASGLTLEQIATVLGISYQTLNEKSKAYSEFSDAIKRGQAQGIEDISNALYENAKGGNVTAQIFFLKNRAPDEWKDVKAREYSGTINHKHTQELSREELFHIAAGGRAGDTAKGSSSGKPAKVH